MQNIKSLVTLYCTVLRFNLISWVQILKIKTLQITIKSKRNYFHGRLAGQLMQLSFSPLRHQINIEFLHLRQAMLGCSGWLDHQHSF